MSGNMISIEARVVSVADAIEAMLSDRPYRKARTTNYIIEELQRYSGTQFDPLVTEVAIQILKEMESEKITEIAVELSHAQFQNSSARSQFLGPA
jgi:HD-GYP domain-containing protein (c-di-GMP phosphodiesterase class II)